jgi:hypothetical protein
MDQSFLEPEQRLSQISVDILSQMAELQKLRVAIKSLEASKRRNGLKTRYRRPNLEISALSARRQLGA